ncbi:MAG: hypothetical protein IPO63_17640 [Bacteroidetes bacterium]|nr:hypothetical protein [Bacteroidota bacterium]
MDAEEAKSYQLKLNEKILEKQKLALEEKTQKEAEELKRKEEARKPIPFIGILNTKKTILEGEVMDVKNGKGIVRFVVNDQSIDALMNGLNNPDIGSIVICTIPQLSGGKIKEVNFKGYKK